MSDEPSQSDAEPVVIGLCGAIGAGKSTVARLLAERGAAVSDADSDSRSALELEEVKSALVAWWGPGMVGEDGGVDRSRVAERVFADPSERQKLESLIHPIVRQARAEAFAEARAEGVCFFVIDAPLLHEAELTPLCDVVWFVDAPREIRLERVVSGRGWDEAELNRRESAQWSSNRKRDASDRVLNNNGSIEELASQIDTALATLLHERAQA
ncbi:MAG: dephospho-CoA kinase [Planctomycetota bacterium]